MLEEVMQNNEQMSQKGAKIDTKIHPKLPKGTKGEPKGRQPIKTQARNIKGCKAG